LPWAQLQRLEFHHGLCGDLRDAHPGRLCHPAAAHRRRPHVGSPQMTAQIELRNIDKYYGGFHALKSISLTIEKGSFVALVGPSGCGKSTLLRSIAGLETISSGTVTIAGQAMTGVPPRRRDVAMVFQSYALYPHMTVE